MDLMILQGDVMKVEGSDVLDSTGTFSSVFHKCVLMFHCDGFMMSSVIS